MKLLFFGIYGIGEKSLARLCEAGHTPAAVVTKPDAPDAPQPVARAAASLGLPLYQPESPRGGDFVAAIRDLAPDLCVVAGYHKIIPPSVLDVPRLGTLNLHGSMLPQYRGPCPWKWAILRGETTTGVTVHYMTPQLDNGDIVTQRPIPILPEDTSADLFDRISEVGARLLAETVTRMERGETARTPQDESRASYFGYPCDEDCRMDWTRPAAGLRDQVRGLNPSPGAWTCVRERKVRIWEATIHSHPPAGSPPGVVLRCDDGGFIVATGEGLLEVTSAGADGAPRPRGIWRPSDLGISAGLRLGLETEE